MPTHHPPHRSAPVDAVGLARRRAAGLVGLGLAALGVAGFLPGITSGLGELAPAGHASGAHLLGILQVSVVHNLVHLGLGVAGVWAARSARAARAFLLTAGAVFLGLWVHGLVVEPSSAANVVPVDDAGGVLHLLLGIVLVALVLLRPRPVTAEDG